MTANHKTGTEFKNCLVRITSREHVTQLYSASNHVSGGFRPDAWQLNFVRDPFVMVDSGFMFHRRDSEWWCHQPLNAIVKGMFSVPFAAKTWNLLFFEEGERECGAQPATLQIDPPAESYSEVLSRFPLVSGLLMEILRVLLFDATVMMQAVHSCLRANQLSEGERSSGDSPACVNVLLDDVTEAGMAALDNLVIPQLRIQDENFTLLREDYRMYCSVVSRRFRGHSTVPHHADLEQEKEQRSPIDSLTGTGREQRLEIIEQLDRIYFGGTLSKYRDIVLRSVHRPPANATAAPGILTWRMADGAPENPQ